MLLKLLSPPSGGNLPSIPLNNLPLRELLLHGNLGSLLLLPINLVKIFHLNTATLTSRSSVPFITFLIIPLKSVYCIRSSSNC
nr:hypothetical protein Q903MT_gene3548 [Picea sitchensis]